MNILFIGDIFGKPGRKIVADHVADLARTRSADLVIANCENAAAGFGITPRLVEELLALGVDVLTSGNHIWDRKEILEYFPKEPRLLRPANYPGGPGRGSYVGRTKSGIEYAVLNFQGRVFMAQTDCPFRTADRELELLPASCKIRIVDMHLNAVVAIVLRADAPQWLSTETNRYEYLRHRLFTLVQDVSLDRVSMVGLVTALNGTRRHEQ